MRELEVGDFTMKSLDNKCQLFFKSQMIGEKDISLSDVLDILKFKADIIEFFSKTVTTPKNKWMQTLFSIKELSYDLEEWVPPSSTHIKMIIGSDSFSGLSVADVSIIVGINPNSMRKIVANDKAISRQKITYVMWHYLLAALEIKEVPLAKDIVKERTGVAKKKGNHSGRQQKMTDKKIAILNELRQSGASIQKISDSIELSVPTIYRYLRKSRI